MLILRLARPLIYVPAVGFSITHERARGGIGNGWYPIHQTK